MKRFLLLIPLLMAVFLLVSVQAHASFVMIIDDPSTMGFDVVVIDNQAAGAVSGGGSISTVADGSAQQGLINFSGGLAGTTWVASISTGSSKPLIGNANRATLDLNSVSISGGSVGVLDIFLTDTDFLLLPPGNFVLTNNLGGTTEGTVEAQGSLDKGNGEFGFTDQTPFQGPFGVGPFSDSSSTLISAFAGSFSLTEWVRITHGAAADVTSFNKQLIAAVPEPATMLLSGLGLLGIGAYLRRRSKKA